MNINIRTVLDGIFPVETEDTDTMELLKFKICSLKGYSPALQQIYFKGARIDEEDQATVKDKNIKSNDILILLMRLNSNYKTYMTQEQIDEMNNPKNKPVANIPIDFDDLFSPTTPSLQSPQFTIPQAQIPSIPPPPPLKLDQIPVDQSMLEILMSMGFAKNHAHKALVLNFMDVNSAAEWLLRNMNDPYILEAPLTSAESQRIINQLKLTLPIPPAIQDAVKRGVCTYTITGAQFQNQKWFYCETCNMTQTKGVCESCAKTCHAGHKLSEAKVSTFFCDCGHGDAPSPCKCMNPQSDEPMPDAQ